MNIQREFEKQNGLVRLQGLGLIKGTPANQMELGDEIYFNYGYSYIVVEINPSKTGKTLTVKLEDIKTGATHDKRFGANRLIVLKKN